jgi:hypothetical protein
VVEYDYKQHPGKHPSSPALYGRNSADDQQATAAFNKEVDAMGDSSPGQFPTTNDTDTPLDIDERIEVHCNEQLLSPVGPWWHKSELIVPQAI